MTAASNNPANNESIGEHEVFGPYEVYERLGVGGMATVHRAKERGIEDFHGGARSDTESRRPSGLRKTMS